MFKYILLFTLTLFFLTNTQAEDSSLTLKQQLDRLQREVSDLSKTIFNKSSGDFINSENDITDNSDTSILTNFDLRIYDLEQNIKNLNSSIEEINFALDDLKDIFDEISLEIYSNKINKNDIVNDDTENINSVDEDNTLGNLIISSEDLSEDGQSKKIEDVKISNNEIILNPEEEFQLAFDLLRNQKFDEAKKSLKVFIQKYETNILSGSAHYWLGEIYLLKKEHREAALILAEGYQKFPKSFKAPDMLFKLAESLVSINKVKDSCNTLNKILLEFPDHKITFKSKEKITELKCKISSE